MKPSFWSSPMRRRQILAAAAVELRRTVGGRKTLGLALFAAIPLAVALLRGLLMPTVLRADIGRTTTEVATVFYLLQIRFIVYFACAFLFVRAFRGEVLRRTLHIPFLAPIKRSDLIIGKYLGAVAAASLVLGLSTVFLVAGYHLANGVGHLAGFVTSSTGLAHLGAYLLVTILAVIGYGALFLAAGLLIKNPMVPAALYLGFEGLAPFLPTPIRVFSVARHLHALMPVPISLGPMAAVAADTPAWLAAALILMVAALAVAVAAWRIGRFEIDYSG